MKVRVEYSGKKHDPGMEYEASCSVEIEGVGSVSLWNLGDLPSRLDRASPTLGQHSREIFEELGLDPALFDSLKADGHLIGE